MRKKDVKSKVVKNKLFIHQKSNIFLHIMFFQNTKYNTYKLVPNLYNYWSLYYPRWFFNYFSLLNPRFNNKINIISHQNLHSPPEMSIDFI